MASTSVSSGDLVCSVPNAVIPDATAAGPSSVTDTLSVTTPRVLLDLNVSIEINHGFVGDLQISLTQVDTDTTVQLLDQPGVPRIDEFGCAGTDINVTLDDEASTLAEDLCADVPPTISGPAIPFSALSDFDNELFASDWTLTVSDLSEEEAGTLVSWCLLDTTRPGFPAVFTDSFE